MILSNPGPPWYSARLVNITPNGSTVIGHFEVFDAGGTQHKGLALDGVTVQFLLDIEMPVAPLPDDIHSFVRGAIQKLVIAEYGGDLVAVIQAFTQQGVSF